MEKIKIILLLTIFPLIVFSQENTIQGTITNIIGEPIPGVGDVAPGTAPSSGERGAHVGCGDRRGPGCAEHRFSRKFRSGCSGRWRLSEKASGKVEDRTGTLCPGN